MLPVLKVKADESHKKALIQLGIALPRRLKSLVFPGFYGTAKAVPFQKVTESELPQYCRELEQPLHFYRGRSAQNKLETVAPMKKTAIAIRHVHFEDLGTFEPLLRQRNYDIRYCDAGIHELEGPEFEQANLLVVLGAPIGAFDERTYPFLRQELKLIERRLAAKAPLLGVCLGAQLMARVLGAAVAPMGHKEIGFSPVTLTAAGHASVLAGLTAETSVLHWHGDQFAIPGGLQSLAATPLCPHQAFAAGSCALGLQFHLEADAERIERWLIGHAAELANAGVDQGALRAAAREHGAQLKSAAASVFGAWLDQVDMSV